MHGHIEVFIDGLKTRIDFEGDDDIKGERLVKYFTGLMSALTFSTSTIKDSLRSVLEDLEND